MSADDATRSLKRLLAAERARFEEVEAVAKIGSWETILPDLSLRWSSETFRIFEIVPDQFPGTHQAFIARVHPEDRAAVAAAFQQSLEQPGVRQMEHRIVTPGGAIKVVEERWQTFCDASGRPVRATGTCQDITDRKRLEEAQFNSRQMLLAVLDAIPQRVFWKDAGSRYLGCNRPFAIDMGFTDPKEVIGKSDDDGVWAAEAERYRADDRRVIESGQAKLNYEERLPRPDGSVWWIRTSKVVLRDRHDEVTGVLGVYEDITERKKLEQQFLRAQRLESIGTLAGGIAHDLNNALTPVLMGIALLLEDETSPPKLSMLRTIEESALRGADMVRQVLSFARGVEARRAPLRLAGIVRDVAKIADETFMKSIQVGFDVAPELWAVDGDATQIHQVLMNLCVNARDAMPGGGRLAISLQNETIDEQYAAMVEGKPGPHVVIAVQDTGTGMTPEVLDRIFDPFFTTKDIGKGTGLGLATSLAIVKAHGGFIRVYSEVGRGTTFRLFLPAVVAAPADRVRPPSEDERRGHGELILVVDDESSIRDITSQTLERSGYRVLLAQDGAEAVALYAGQGREIAAVVIDMMMPVMDGAATVQVLMRIDPRVRIIACSGRLDSERLPREATDAIRTFLPKPYTAQALLTAIADVLASGQ